MTTPTGEPRTQSGREFLADLPGRYGQAALDPVSHDLTVEAILAIEREAAAATEPRPDPTLDDREAITALAKAACAGREPLPVDYDDAWASLRYLRQHGYTLARLAGTASASAGATGDAGPPRE